MQEEWRVITGFPSYAVSSVGRVKRITPGRGTHPGRLIRLWPGTHGYVRCSIRNNEQVKFLVHRLVAIEFLGGRTDERDCVNHIDGVKTNNHASNLEWCSHRENTDHAMAHGLVPKGTDNGNARLTESQVLEIRKLSASGATMTSIGRMYGVSNVSITNIRIRKTWKHI